ncbi:hypothetical protein M419DRAFT_125374 [Trichoderma reesei RUT C-30]|uniref:Uncharacterized protein n=1 Tax=Hypocrea jecorina (strain ATCC 56765 / BCRC 32924 / NRRL 11460 / Rut C-30) TaxID=1344414 RepID=A0A024RWB6_HYPJR|nr:hypothetical protein M419DRAFT_125374 [Trichoderma reesei RUT C-30]
MHTPCAFGRTWLGDWRENGDIVTETVLLLPRKSRYAEELPLEESLKPSSRRRAVRNVRCLFFEKVS